MVFTRKDIEVLLRKATPDERKQLFVLLDGEDGLKNTDVKQQVETLVDKLFWKYQTPLGYFFREPTFDEICVGVAKRLKLKGLVRKQISCWELLERIIRNMWEDMINNMSEEERKTLAESIFEDEEFKEAAKKANYDWTKVGAGAALLAIKKFGGFATYKMAVIIANQAARALLGRGLTLAANAALTRTISIVLGPVGWLLLAWGINDLLGTNYKRIIPAVLYLYCIYERLDNQKQLPDGF